MRIACAMVLVGLLGCVERVVEPVPCERYVWIHADTLPAPSDVIAAGGSGWDHARPDSIVTVTDSTLLHDCAPGWEGLEGTVLR